MFDVFINFLRLFRDISPADAAIIESGLSYKKVAEGDVLLNEGQLCKEMLFVCKGVLRIVSQNEKGNKVAYFFLKENQFCSILNSFNNNTPAVEGIEAACDAEIIVIKKQKLLNLYQQLPYLKELITGITTQALLDKIQMRNSYMGENATVRYHNFLVRQPEIALRVSLSDVASYLGIAQQSLSRIRKNG
jgi:CRP/FNR family transcriptional regulator, anaerobic regulatory protein